MPHVEETENPVEDVSVEEEKEASPEVEAAAVPKSSDDEQDKAEEHDEEDDNEYEIEAIIDAKRGYFTKGHYAYLVRWKGYTSEHNSWVSHEDAGNADELISEYWKKMKKAGQQGRKSGGRQSSSAAPGKRGRSSISKDKSPAPTPARRGKGRSKAGRAESTEKEDHDAPGEEDDVDEEEQSRGKKKPRRSAENGIGRGGRRKSLARINKDTDGDVEMNVDSAPLPPPSPDVEGDDPPKFISMDKFMHEKSWEALVKAVDTVERVEKDELVVYFTLNNGKRAREKASLCRKRFPFKLIKFYESNLRWKATELTPDPASAAAD